MMDPATRLRFWSELIARLSLTITNTGWRPAFFEEWARWEGTGAKFNPLATTRVGPPLDPVNPYWNSNGGNPVKNYATFEAGVEATAQTLELSYYTDLMASLSTEAILAPTRVAANIDIWGTAGFANAIRNGWRPDAAITPAERDLLTVTRERVYQLFAQVFGNQQTQTEYAAATFADLLSRIKALEAVATIGSIAPHTHTTPAGHTGDVTEARG